ncbi:hypothetical protein [Stappia indica]|uniref:hypothetical protein n=1 Tax=Stappia indica TaxID=538381 RepID=UPI001CD25013|nr:hypothetical protein [Stappia indica]MCA1297153.1 hypothetical protein [Stappia indica]
MTFVQQPSEQHFRNLAIATVAAAAILAGVVSLSQSLTSAPAAADPATAETVISNLEAKTNRQTKPLPAACEGQSWGNWSSDCINALEGNRASRQIRFETHEDRSVSNRTSILTRVPIST